MAHLNLVLNELDSDTEFLQTLFPIATTLCCMDHVNRSNIVDCDHLPYTHHNFFGSNILSEHRNLVRPLLHMYLWIPFELQKLHFRIQEYIAESKKKKWKTEFKTQIFRFYGEYIVLTKEKSSDIFNLVKSRSKVLTLKCKSNLYFWWFLYRIKVEIWTVELLKL